MNSRETHPNPPFNHKIISFSSRNPSIFLVSIFVVLLSISLSIPRTREYFRSQHFRSTLSPHLTLFLKTLGFFPPIPIPNPNSNLFRTKEPNPFCILWMAPFLSGGGYSSEAWSYVLALHDHLHNNPVFRLSIEQHGDRFNLRFWEGLPMEMRELAHQLYQTQTRCGPNETVVICHSEPGAWYPPLFQTLPCPPENAKYAIGRTMFETDRVDPEHVRRCNVMDSVWVPTDFHVSSFIQSGVDPSKVVKMVQPVDTKFFDPMIDDQSLELESLATLVLGNSDCSSSTFRFLSIFKWEYRKGWDVLLRSYLKEFSHPSDQVALYLLTNPYHSDRDFGNKILEFVEEDMDLGKVKDGSFPPVYVIDSHIAQVDLPRLYKAAGAFVLPSRGEGWGRPIVEAMAMSLPVIATNWSGPTEYLTQENSYPLPVDRMSEVKQGPFKGHHWAEPSVEKLRFLMRHVMNNPVEAKAKGKQAREDMINRFSPEIVAKIVVDHLQQIVDSNMV